MKRLVPAAILFVIVIISYFGSLNYINGVCDDAKEQVSRCETEYRSGGNAEEKVRDLQKLWDEKEGNLSFFVNHGEIDEVELELASLSVFVKEKENAMFYDHIESLKTLLHQIKEDTSLSTHSIF